MQLADSSDANRKGIGMVFQEQSLLTNLTVGENIYLGNEAQFTRAGLVDWKRLYAAASRQLEKVNLDVDPRMRAVDLDFASRQMVEIAKALTLEERRGAIWSSCSTSRPRCWSGRRSTCCSRGCAR